VRGGETIVPAGPLSSAGTVTDSNGNEISVDANGHFTDTTGNVVLTVSGVAPSAHTFQYADTNGNTQTVQVTYATYTVQTAFGCSGTGEYGPAQTPLVDTISFPDGSAYHFSYEPTPGGSGSVTGRLAGVQLPQGNWISYRYSGANGGIECADGSAAGLTRSLNADSGSAASAPSYTRTFPNGTGTSHTDVVDGLGNYLAYDFVQPSNLPSGTTAGYYEVKRRAYQGSGSGTPAVTKYTCINQSSSSSPCAATGFALPINTIDNYELRDGIEMRSTSISLNSLGQTQGSSVSDFGGPSNVGGILRVEDMLYGNYFGMSLPGRDTVYDAALNLAGQTSYSYDTSAPTTSYGVPQHVAGLGAGGNLTLVTQSASSNVSYSTTNTYEDTGSLLTSASPNGTTTYSYDPTFVYNTGVSSPTPSSGVAIGTSASFDTAYTGLQLSSIDANSKPTNFTSYDSMLRLTRVQYPDQGSTTWSYTPTQLSQHVYQSSTIYSDTETQYDGYGRQSRVAIANGQSGNSWYQKDTCYDANGNVGFSSYWYQGTGLSAAKVCSGAGDTYTYDVLGRLTLVTRANGESSSTTYLGRATRSIDENGVTRIAQVDGLGRTTIVCEVSLNGAMPGSGSPASCGTDIAGTGFTTTYSYALASGTTTVTQGGQTRIFQSDWLGRPISVTEPESGTTTYSYAYNSTGLQVTRTRPQANQPNSSVTTTTTAQYDSLGRIVSITYSDGTRAKTYAYDQNAGSNFADLSQMNLKGRLSAASTASAGTAYSYDAMGRVSYLDECLPSGCGTVADNRQLHYTYDLAGNLLTSTDGSGVQSTYTVSPANEVLSLTSSLSNTTNPAGILASVQNGPNGPLHWNIGNGLSGVDGYDALGRLSGGWVCQGSTSANCPGGTQLYGFTAGWSGDRMSGSADSVLNQGSTYGYDEFDRLSSRTVTSGTAQNFAWVYDRWGNRWQQNVTAGSGPEPQLSFNTATNQITGSGYAYDAAGNMTSDWFHTYVYDADGNVAAVDGGGTAQYVYDALNHRVRSVTSAGTLEFVFNANGQRVSEWDGTTRAQLKGKYYWGSQPVAWYAPGGAAHFEHQDWEGTERLRTAYNGGVEGTFTSLPYGDAQAASGANGDPYHFAMLDSDTESGTDHAQYRQYSSTQGRWLSPDPYSGSYDFSNPQSLNRYSHALNNPLSYVDPLGLDHNAYMVIGSCIYTYHVTNTTSVNGNTVAVSVDEELVGVFCGGSSSGVRAGGGGGSSAPNNAKKTPLICGGTFGFGGLEADAVEGGAFAGGIVESDSQNGMSGGSLVEAWLGGEGPVAGVGKITSPSDTSVLHGFLGFVGAGINAGPLAGLQVGYVAGKGWGGLYVEGHVGVWAAGTGGYLRSCSGGD